MALLPCVLLTLKMHTFHVFFVMDTLWCLMGKSSNWLSSHSWCASVGTKMPENVVREWELLGFEAPLAVCRRVRKCLSHEIQPVPYIHIPSTVAGTRRRCTYLTCATTAIIGFKYSTEFWMEPIQVCFACLKCVFVAYFTHITKCMFTFVSQKPVTQTDSRWIQSC